MKYAEVTKIHRFSCFIEETSRVGYAQFVAKKMGMEKIKVIHDVVGRTLTIWLAGPSKETICEETVETIVTSGA